MEKFYELANGSIVREYALSQAFLITTGIQSCSEPVLYSKFLKGLANSGYAIEHNPTLDELIAKQQLTCAITLYRDQHNCTLSEAKIAIDKMRE